MLQPVSTPVPPSAPPAGRKVLVVSSDRLSRMVFWLVLRRQGYRVVTAGNASDALDDCVRNSGDLDLILLDVNVPGLEGPPAVWMLRRLNPSARVCVVVGDIDPERDEDFLDLGAAAVLRPPFSGSQLAHLFSLLVPTDRCEFAAP